MRLLNEKQTAEMLAVSPSVLRKLRCTGASPGGMPEVPFIRMGTRIRYREPDVLAYIDALANDGEGAAV